jgi:GNAT superfamily N-acetyltransferase
VVRPVLGVASPDGAVVSVPPGLEPRVGEVGADAGADEELAQVGEALGRRTFTGAFRWCEAPAPLEDVGQWLAPSDERVPIWLKPFNGDVLVVLEGDRYVAGVGIKQHDQYGWELAVGTEPVAQGRGLGRRLVAQAARHVLDAGAVPTYLHDFANTASAKVAAAAGFPDRGWRVLGVV